MGGGRQYVYPKWVWSPSGGWWPNPQHWKRNTALYLGFVVFTSTIVWKFSDLKTKTYYPKVAETASHDSHGHH